MAYLFAAAMCASLVFADENPRSVTFLSEHEKYLSVELPPLLRTAADVRWGLDGKVWVAATQKGAYEIDISKPAETNHKPFVGVFPNYGPYGSYWRIARTRQWLILSAPGRAIFWREISAPPDKPPFANELSFDFIIDIDGYEDQLVIFGVRRDRNGAFAPNGIIGWRAQITSEELLYKPFFVSGAGPGARNIDLCGVMDPGKVRFLENGDHVFAPVTEPGVFLYDAEGKLVRTWDTAELGIDAGCDIDQATASRYGINHALREKEWVNKRRFLDEILPLPDGPGLVIRQRYAELTQWHLKTLHVSGTVTVEEIPIVSRSPYAHIKGDVREDGAIVYLVSDLDLDQSSPERPIYLFVSKKALPALPSP